MAGFDAVRSSQVRAVGTAFLRARPWVVAPVAGINLICMLRAQVPVEQLRVLGPGIAALLGFFVYEALRFRREVVREGQLRRSLVITAAALLLACAASGGPRSPMVPLLLAPVGVAFAAFGRGRGNAWLLLAVLLGLAGLVAMEWLPAPFPAIASPQAAVMTVASAAGSLVLLWIGVTGLTTAYTRSGETLARTRDAMLAAMTDRMRGAESLGARVAHEIRNPLTAIKGLVQLLARGEHGERDTKRLAVVLAEVERVEETLVAYLSFARPLAELQPAPVELGGLLGELATLLEARAEAGGIRMVVQTEAVEIVADRRRLQEALLNLASNALEATAPGGTLTLTSRMVRGAARLEVIDDGRGMTSEQLARLGTPFVTGRPGGTGLGVTLTRAVVLQHGGRMTHTSAPNQGTRVTLSLPATPAERSPMAKILIVDDEAHVRFTLTEVLGEAGHVVVAASSGAEALGLADDELDAVISDLSLPGMDGLELLTALHQRDASLPVLLLTARGSERVAVQAMKAGAYDYLLKPFDIDELVHAVGRAVEARLLRREHRRQLAERGLERPIVGDAPALRRVLDLAARVADRELPVLVLGETGTGKELIAGMLHAGSRRVRGPLVRFNCAAVPEALADSELFGHARGAFTGASAARRGYFAQASGGTLVLDEIAELPLAIQAKLLRALQSGEIQPLGAKVEHVDVRVIACTHRDLQAEVAAGRFREDLYYRLAVIELRVPPLRERRVDIPGLADSFARRYAARFGLESVQMSPELIAALVARPWPGNVRELENCVARLVALSSDGRLELAALMEPGTPGPGNLRAQVEAFERGLIEQALRAAGGNHSEAARKLATSRVTLLDKLKKHGLQG